MLQALPVIDWLPEAVEPAVNLVLKRLSKIFDKLIQKPDLVVSTTHGLPVDMLTDALGFLWFHGNFFYNLATIFFVRLKIPAAEKGQLR